MARRASEGGTGGCGVRRGARTPLTTPLFEQRPAPVPVHSLSSISDAGALTFAREAHLERYRETGERKIIGSGRVTTARHRDGTTFPSGLHAGETRIGEERLFTGGTACHFTLMDAPEDQDG